MLSAVFRAALRIEFTSSVALEVYTAFIQNIGREIEAGSKKVSSSLMGDSRNDVLVV
jgi:hypothetical protein